MISSLEFLYLQLEKKVRGRSCRANLLKPWSHHNNNHLLSSCLCIVLQDNLRNMGRTNARTKKGSQQIMKALMMIPSVVEALCSFNPPKKRSGQYQNIKAYSKFTKDKSSYYCSHRPAVQSTMDYVHYNTDK